MADRTPRAPRVAVVGAGVAGLVAARRLAAEGVACDVYERWPGLGGQAATVDVGDGLLLERYYHHLFTSDVDIQALYRELGMGDELEWRDSTMAMFSGGRLWPFTTPGDLLRFGPLPPLSRLRMGLAALYLQRVKRDALAFEHETAAAWVRRVMGEAAWREVWGPMLRGKFADRADEVSMAWLANKLMLRRQIKGEEARQEKLGYPRRSWEPLFGELAARIERGGGRVLIDRPVASLSRADGGFAVVPGAPGSFRTGHDPRAFPHGGEAETYGRVVLTVPSDVALGMLAPDLAAELGEEYRSRLAGAQYCAALCVLLELDRQFSPFYWTNIADDAIPFIGLIEHTNFVEPERYGGRRFLYVANYLPHGHELIGLDPDELVARYVPGLRAVNPAFDPSWIRRRWRFHEPAAQPIVTPGHAARIPPLRTPVDGLFVANTQQIYPEDRGTNYSVALGERVAREVLAA